MKYVKTEKGIHKVFHIYKLVETNGPWHGLDSGDEYIEVPGEDGGSTQYLKVLAKADSVSELADYGVYIDVVQGKRCLYLVPWETKDDRSKFMNFAPCHKKAFVAVLTDKCLDFVAEFKDSKWELLQKDIEEGDQLC